MSFKFIRIVSFWLLQKGMKAPWGGDDTLRRRQYAPLTGQIHPQAFAESAGGKLRRLARQLKRAAYRIEDSWIGDLIGLLSLVVSLIGGLLIGHAMSGGGL